MNKKSLKFSPVGTIFKFTCRTESVNGVNLHSALQVLKLHLKVLTIYFLKKLYVF